MTRRRSTDALAATRAAVRGWRDAHARGSTHRRRARAAPRGDGGAVFRESAAIRRGDARRNKRWIPPRAPPSAGAAPRVAAFLRRGGATRPRWRPHRSACDAAQGVASAAKTCQESRARRRSLRRVWEIALRRRRRRRRRRSHGRVAGGAPGRRPPDRRAGLWLLTLAGAREGDGGGARGGRARRARRARRVARRRSTEGGSLDAETLAGCAEVWRARAFVDEALLRVLAGAEPPA